ncbi:hypothetical protein FAZ95_13070 [Trinickia violacea]|uniref:Uncharacterized protein n=1 Tax=Trinickia violacea TaxID=2571746 RepID=A0A4V1EHE9_9BURK|nr:hypothetical protein [Trinickia violacea]QCP50030.1 hypothetical protein FAZ95_13070 [Trinickia violacea]
MPVALDELQEAQVRSLSVSSLLIAIELIISNEKYALYMSGRKVRQDGRVVWNGIASGSIDALLAATFKHENIHPAANVVSLFAKYRL